MSFFRDVANAPYLQTVRNQSHLSFLFLVSTERGQRTTTFLPSTM